MSRSHVGAREAAPALAGAVALVLGLIPLAVGAPAAAAPEPAVTWSVSPADADGPDGTAWIEQEADPGQAIQEHLAVRNLGEIPATFRLSAADGYFTEAGRFTMLQAGETSVAAGTWIDLPAEVSVEAGGTAVIPFTVTVPENATPGDHAAGVAASVVSEGTTAEGARVGVESRVGIRVITRVSGELAPSLALSGLAADYTTSWNPFAPGRMSVSYTAENTGNVQLAVRDRVGGAETERGDMLPGDRRDLVADAYAQWPLGPVEVEVVLDGEIGGADDAGAGPAPERATIVVWAVPWPQLMLLVGILLIVAAVLLGRRRGQRKLDRLLQDAREEGRREAVR